jgi:hypothetical protein
MALGLIRVRPAAGEVNSDWYGADEDDVAIAGPQANGYGANNLKSVEDTILFSVNAHQSSSHDSSCDLKATHARLFASSNLHVNTTNERPTISTHYLIR